MKHGKISGLAKTVSRLVLGTLGNRDKAFMMFDDFFRQGGNCFDTAYIYGGGKSDKNLGEWIKARSVGNQVVILGKGAHTPHCNPQALSKQLLESLERLQANTIDIYMMHRDNLDIPVGEFVDVLNEHQRAGRIGTFGGSNWTIERLEEANTYAKTKGLNGFTAVSNNFSLARMVEAPWEGCLAASDPQSRGWFTRTQTPLMPWSSQARGFFVRGRAEDRSDKDLVRCWYSDDNFQRLARAREMAAKRGCEPVNIALAYVLCQPFPAFPLIGPQSPAETSSCMAALNIELTVEDLRWLNLES